MKNVILIVGLGNITNRYSLTRHNIGFLCLEFISKILHGRYTDNEQYLGMESLCGLTLSQVKWRNDKKLDSIIASMPIADFVAPLCNNEKMLQNIPYFKRSSADMIHERFMTLSKTDDISSYQVVLAAPTTFMNNSGVALRKIQNMYDNVHTIVIYDDLDTPFGTLNIKLKGGDGGHNGIRSINAHCSKEYLRVKLGIGVNLFTNQGAFYSIRDKYDDLVDFEFLNECYSFVFLQRLRNNKQFKTSTLFKILKQHMIEQINSDKSSQEKIIKQIDMLFKDFAMIHKTLGRDTSHYVLSDFNTFEMTLLSRILEYTCFSIMCVIFDSIKSGKFSSTDSFNINHK